MTPGYAPLDPVSFLDRSRVVFADRIAVRDRGRAWSYAELGDRADRLAGGLVSLGVRPGDRVSVLAPNSAALLECHFGVPAAGAVLNTINTRLSPTEVRAILVHARASVLIVHETLSDVARLAVAGLADAPRLVTVTGGPDGDYEQLLAGGPIAERPLVDEMEPFSLNYTSGTTGAPKGVLYSRRGAYLQSLAMVIHAGMRADSVYLWVVPMFHCNGWCFPWAVSAVGGEHITPASVDATTLWSHLRTDSITHLSAAPTVLTSLAYADEAAAGPVPRTVNVTTGGAPPSPALLDRLRALNLDVTHLYGLTESYGPAALNDWRPEWDDLPQEEAAALRARQGVSNVVSPSIRVVSTDDGSDLPADGRSVGEVMLGGNTVMLGYYRDEEATSRASSGGWLRTGDLGLRHPDGYLQLTDRAKDIIITGGENVASIEVEQAIDSHPAVLESAVIGTPDDHWGEIVTAVVTLHEGQQPSRDELSAHVRKRLAGYKVPRIYHFGPLPKTSTGKIRKAELRSRVADQPEY